MSYTLAQIARVNATLRIGTCTLVNSPLLLCAQQRAAPVIVAKQKKNECDDDEPESDDEDDLFVAIDSEDSGEEYKQRIVPQPKRKAVHQQPRRTAARIAQQKMVELCVVSESEDAEEEEEDEDEEDNTEPQPEPTPVAAAAPVAAPEEKSADDESSLAPPLHNPSAKLTCTDCWRTLVTTSDVLWRCGLVHMLFVFKDLFRRAWHLWERYFTDPRSGAWRADSEPMRKWRGVCESNGIAWNSRCLALVLPFDRSHRAQESARHKPFGVADGVGIHAPWINTDVLHTLRAGFLYLVRVTVQDARITKANNFFDCVVRKALPLLHEQKARAARGVDVCLAELEHEFVEREARDAVYQYACSNGFAQAARWCPELAARQAQPATKMRDTNDTDMRVLVHTNALGRAHDTLDEAAFEARMCAIVRDATDRSAADYAWPLEIGVAADAYSITMRRQKDSFSPVLERTAPSVHTRTTVQQPTTTAADDSDSDIEIIAPKKQRGVLSPKTKRRLADMRSEELARGLQRSLHDSADTWLPVKQFFESMAQSTEPLYSDSAPWEDLLDKAEAEECIQQVLMNNNSSSTPKKAAPRAPLSPRAIDHTSAASIEECHAQIY